MDIKGLYTNIPNDYGLNTMKYFVEKHKIQNPPTHTLSLAELVLTKNCFGFDDTFHSHTGVLCLGLHLDQNIQI